MAKYFVGRLLNEPQSVGACRRTDNYVSTFFEVLWEGDDYHEGLKRMKEANSKMRLISPPKPSRPPKPDPSTIRYNADQEKLRKWIEGAKQ